MTQPHPPKDAATPPPEPPADAGDPIFGDLILRYTRAQAIEDGVLIDVSDMARECGFRLPVAVTRAVWSDCIEVLPTAEGQDEAGRLWDVLTVLRFAINRHRDHLSDRLDFTVHVRHEPGRAEDMDLYARCGPGDDMEPVITVMRPEED